MGCAVQFDVAAFRTRYPEFALVQDAQLAACFAEATDFQRNDGGGPVADCALQSRLLNMLTAHIAFMSYPVGGTGPSPLVGRVSSATQGSVSVQTQYSSDTSDMAAWANQTKYGATWWAATAQFRTFRGVTPRPTTFYPGYGWPWVR